MAKTNKIVEEGVQTDYTSVIVSYSNGIDSTGALYWVLQEFPREKIYLLYCDTGFDYEKIFVMKKKWLNMLELQYLQPKTLNISHAFPCISIEPFNYIYIFKDVWLIRSL